MCSLPQKVVLQRALPFAVRTAWNPRLYERVLSVREVGVEDLTIEFPWSEYSGRDQEQGLNAVELSGVYDSWVKDVEVVNADNAVLLSSEWGVGGRRAGGGASCGRCHCTRHTDCQVYLSPQPPMQSQSPA